AKAAQYKLRDPRKHHGKAKKRSCRHGKNYRLIGESTSRSNPFHITGQDHFRHAVSVEPQFCQELFSTFFLWNHADVVFRIESAKLIRDHSTVPRTPVEGNYPSWPATIEMSRQLIQVFVG